MATLPRAPKQWQLTKIETITSYESWRQNLIYVLSLDENFVPFIDATWEKQTAANPQRGLPKDGTAVPEAQRLTPAQKEAHLDLLLGQIANFSPVISRNSTRKLLMVLSFTTVNGNRSTVLLPLKVKQLLSHETLLLIALSGFRWSFGKIISEKRLLDTSYCPIRYHYYTFFTQNLELFQNENNYL